jgi:hypothetical protein
MMEIATRYLETGDRSVLLELPSEQRSLLESEIEKYLRLSGKVPHEIDPEIDALIEEVEQRRQKRLEAKERLEQLTSPVDSRRIESLLEKYDVRRRPAGALRPLVRGKWTAVSKKSAGPLIQAMADGEPGATILLTRPGLAIQRVDQCPVSFSKGFLYQAHIDLAGRQGAFDFWSDGKTAVLFDGSSAPIHRLVNDGALGVVGNEVAYLTLYCSALRGANGRFEIVDPAATAVAKVVHAKNPAVSLATPAAADVDGQPGYTASLIYGDRLYLSRFRMDPASGVVDMLPGEPLLSDIGLRQEAFDGPLRLWAS